MRKHLRAIKAGVKSFASFFACAFDRNALKLLLPDVVHAFAHGIKSAVGLSNKIPLSLLAADERRADGHFNFSPRRRFKFHVTFALCDDLAIEKRDEVASKILRRPARVGFGVSAN